MRKCWIWLKNTFLSIIRAINNLNVSLRFKIISIVILAIVLPAFFFGVILTSISRSTLRESIFHRQQEIVQRLADRINTQLEYHHRILLKHQTMGNLLPGQQINAAFDIISLGTAFSEVSLIDSHGRELWKYRRDGGLVRQVASRVRGKIHHSLSREKSSISQVYFSGQHNPYIILSIPLSGKKGVLSAKLDFEQLWQWIEEVKVGDTGQAFIVDKKGNLIAHKEPERVLAHSNFSNLPVVKDFMAQRAIASSKDWREYHDERGESVVALYQVIPRLGWAVVIQISSAEVYAPVRAMYRTIIFWTVFWSGVFLFAGYHLVGRIVHPLLLLQSGTEQIARGKLDISLDIHTGDEVEELAKNFERMATALQRSEKLKQDLTGMIIHDLKSPLSGIMGSLDYLESGLMGEISEDHKKIISLAKNSSETMLVMVQNLLDVAKMEEGKLELRKEAVDVGLLIKERVSQFTALVASENKKITAVIEPNLPAVSVERHLIERVLNNLISNAINHTSTSRGTITLGAQRKGDMFEIRIEDNGIGIPPEYLDKIFEKFVQVERRQAKLRTGAGLGLTFCKMVVETHGGNIRVESQVNRGSAFIFTLPL